MAKSAQPFLMFQDKNAEEAINFYVSLFADGKINEIARYGANQGGPEGTVMVASFTVAGQVVKCSDSPVRHQFGFTPSISLFVECESEAEIERLNMALSENGQALMPIDNYGFSRRFAWLQDRFGVSWQINLA
jgi:predicted 3-demethylubiquinone-9 3-methyltransferase (glyoxalase superfamily)